MVPGHVFQCLIQEDDWDGNLQDHDPLVPVQRGHLEDQLKNGGNRNVRNYTLLIMHQMVDRAPVDNVRQSKRQADEENILNTLRHLEKTHWKEGKHNQIRETRDITCVVHLVEMFLSFACVLSICLIFLKWKRVELSGCFSLAIGNNTHVTIVKKNLPLINSRPVGILTGRGST